MYFAYLGHYTVALCFPTVLGIIFWCIQDENEVHNNWAASRQNQQNDGVLSENSDQPGHLWSESSRFAQWVAKDPSFLHSDSEDSDQTGHMPRLIWVFIGHMSFCWFCREVAHMCKVYRNDPKFRQRDLGKQCRLWTDCSWRNSLIRASTVCHSICIHNTVC